MEKLLGLLESEKETIQARAAEDVIEFAQRALEHEDLEKRVAALEELIRDRRTADNEQHRGEDQEAGGKV